MYINIYQTLPSLVYPTERIRVVERPCLIGTREDCIEFQPSLQIKSDHPKSFEHVNAASQDSVALLSAWRRGRRNPQQKQPVMDN